MKPQLKRIEGEQISLEPFSEKFITPEYLSWLKDEEATRWLVKAGPEVGLDDVRAFCHQMINSSDDYFFAIVQRSSNHHIGNLRIGPIDWGKRIARFGILIGGKDARGRGIGTEAMALVERFCFEVLCLNEMRFPVVAAHIGALRMYEKAGFDVFGSWPEDFIKEGHT